MKQKVKHRTKQILTCLMILAFLLQLCGCTLANEVEGADGQEKDLLIGAFITRNPIEKTYASFEWVDIVNASSYPTDITFDGIEGMLFYGYESKMDGDDESDFWARGKNIFNRTDKIIEDENGRHIKLSAEIYYASNSEDEINYFYMNPVYETPDGEIYVVPGIAYPGAKGESRQQLSLKEAQKRTFLDGTTTESIEISVTLIKENEPLHIYLYQMTENNEILKVEEYIPPGTGGAHPGIYVEPETDYVLMETEQRLPDHSTVIKREMIDWEGQTMTIEQEDGTEVEEKISLFDTFYYVVDGFLAKDRDIVYWTAE